MQSVHSHSGQETVDSPCYFPGYSVAVGGAKLQGTGNAAACRGLVKDALDETRFACEKAGATSDGSPCLGAFEGTPKAAKIVAGSLQFVAVSGFLFVTDFARWWLDWNGGGPAAKNFPKPSLGELTEAADKLCTGQWLEISKRTEDDKLAHQFTGSQKAPHRCMEINYIVTLLRSIYGFPVDGRFIEFADEFNENSVEWPLGAHLSLARGSKTSEDSEL